MSAKNTGSSTSWRGDARYRYSTGEKLSRDESWLREKEFGEKWPRFSAEIPPELAEQLDAAQKKSLGVNYSEASATRANMVRAALRLYLNHADPEPDAPVEGFAVEIFDLPALNE